MLFSKLQSLLSPGASLKFEITMNDDATLSVIVCPKGNTGALSQPLVITATADELDTGFVEVLEQYQKARLSLQEQLEATTAVLDAAKKSEEKKAVKALTNKPSPAVKEKITPKSSDNDDHGDGLDEHGDEAENASTTGTTPSVPTGNLSNLFD